MPNNLIFIRHGQSEANIVHRHQADGKKHHNEEDINDRPDWRQRLSALGIQQAKAAGDWLRRNQLGAETFDALYVSPFLRTRETAAYIGGPACGGWTIDDRVVERSWGIYGIVPRAEQRSQFPLTQKLHKATPWYVRFDGGESMPDVYGRFRDFQGVLHREQDGKNVLVVSHGDFINVARYGIERMRPEEWEAMDQNPAYTIRNCTIVQYTRVNPTRSSDIRPKIRWRRIIYPDAMHESPDNANWVELYERRRYTGTELIEQAEIAKPIM